MKRIYSQEEMERSRRSMTPIGISGLQTRKIPAEFTGIRKRHG